MDTWDEESVGIEQPGFRIPDLKQVIPEGRDLHTPKETKRESLSPAAINAELNRNAYRLTPATFAHEISFHQWIPAKHLKFISAKVATAFAKGRARICISIPPRHGKSELFSVYMPVWLLDRDPGRRIMQCAYAAELATEFSHRVRDIIAEDHIEGYNQIHAKLRKDSKRADRFRTTVGVGGVVAAGVGGAITGRGANDLLVDDYMKNAKESQSEVIRRDHWEWFKSTAMTRLEPNGNVAIIATRWNVDDLIGRLMLEEPDAWQFITLKAIAEEDDILGREPGEPLWPERYSIEDLHSIRDSLGTFWWQALYQQDPLESMSNLFQDSWVPIIERTPPLDTLRLVRYWDFASTAGDNTDLDSSGVIKSGGSGGGDFTVGAKLGYDPTTGITYIIDLVRGRWSPGTVESIVRVTAQEDGFSTKVVIEQEPGSAGKTVISRYKTDVLKGYRMQGDRVTGPKPVRAQPFLAAAEAGKVRMLTGNWNKALKDEFKGFPDGLHDDIVDAVSGGYTELTNRLGNAGTWGRKPTAAAEQTHTALETGSVWGRSTDASTPTLPGM